MTVYSGSCYTVTGTLTWNLNMAYLTTIWLSISSALLAFPVHKVQGSPKLFSKKRETEDPRSSAVAAAMVRVKSSRNSLATAPCRWTRIYADLMAKPDCQRIKKVVGSESYSPWMLSPPVEKVFTLCLAPAVLILNSNLMLKHLESLAWMSFMEPRHSDLLPWDPCYY